MKTTIAVSSGKGGTGKTFVSTNLALAFNYLGKKTSYLDCDAEEPNGHLFLKPEIEKEGEINIFSPSKVDKDKCILCSKCAASCRYNAIAKIKDNILIFKNLCHNCGACKIICPTDAIINEKRIIGKIKSGNSNGIHFTYGMLQTGEGGMTPRVIRRVKENIMDGINILDSPPGTSCPVVETVKNSNITLLVTDPTPFGINDLKLSVDMCRELGTEPYIVINRAEDNMDSLLAYCASESLNIIGQIPDERKIAECYSLGDLVFEKLDEYKKVFLDLAENILHIIEDKPLKVMPSLKAKTYALNNLTKENITCTPNNDSRERDAKEIVVISGKGGTGKTSISASLAALDKNIAIADCDVDAADLHLILSPKIQKRGLFSGGDVASIDNNACISCGACFAKCTFDAIIKQEESYIVDSTSCEGCGVCSLVCKAGAVKMEPALNGEWFVSDFRFGNFSHAKLAVASENSGKLVTLVRENARSFKPENKIIIIDGSPGTGCPVISSITGAAYVVIVTEPTVSGIHDMVRVIDLINFFNLKAGVIVNKFDLNTSKSDEIREIAGKSSLDFLGEIPYDKIITDAQKEGLSIVEFAPKSIIADKINKIWHLVKQKA